MPHTSCRASKSRCSDAVSRRAASNRFRNLSRSRCETSCSSLTAFSAASSLRLLCATTTETHVRHAINCHSHPIPLASVPTRPVVMRLHPVPYPSHVHRPVATCMHKQTVTSTHTETAIRRPPGDAVSGSALHQYHHLRTKAPSEMEAAGDESPKMKLPPGSPCGEPPVCPR